jgi:hypothetical protein
MSASKALPRLPAGAVYASHTHEILDLKERLTAVAQRR